MNERAQSERYAFLCAVFVATVALVLGEKKFSSSEFSNSEFSNSEFSNSEFGRQLDDARLNALSRVLALRSGRGARFERVETRSPL